MVLKLGNALVGSAQAALRQRALTPCLVRVAALPPRCPARRHFSHTPSRLTAAADKKPYYITTPIFYVNASPHVGHLHSMVLADVAARYQTWRTGTQAVLATGTDEHGLKIQLAAEKGGETPKELCDRVSGTFRRLAAAAQLAPHTFIRTTEAAHADAVAHLWRTLRDAGHIYLGTHAGWYAVSDEAFYTEAQVRPALPDEGGEGMVSVETGTRVEWYEEHNYKFRLGDFREKLIEWLENDENAILPPSRHAQVLSELKTGLSDLSISRPRTRLAWGIPVPDDEDHTIYVWIDALTNYLSVTGYPWSDGVVSPPSNAWPADAHVVGKDIIRFHAVYWPAMLLAAGLPLPRSIVTHGHWTLNRSKMSKSRGNVADPFDVLARIGVDEVRWFLCRVGGGLASDADWSEPKLRELHKKALQGQLGNLLSRVAAPKILEKVLLGQREVVMEQPEVQLEDEKLKTALLELPDIVEGHISRFEMGKVLEAISGVLALTNEHVAMMEPWAKTTSVASASRSLYYALESLRITSALLAPFMPARMEQLRTALQLGEQDVSLEAIRSLRKEVRLWKREEKVKLLFPPLPEEEVLVVEEKVEKKKEGRRKR